MTNHSHPHPDATDESALAEMLDLDAEVLDGHLAEVADWLGELTADRPPRRILDLGCGTGTGTFTLLRRFEEAEATAVDRSPHMLHHLRARAEEAGVAYRVRTVQADLDDTWPAVGTPDLVWASASLHHTADPDRVLSEVLTALRPGGLLALVEAESFLPHFLPDTDDGPAHPGGDHGAGGTAPVPPGLEARCHAALAEVHERDVPLLGSDWGALLARAGFTVAAERHFAIDLRPPLPASAGRYAQATLRRLRSHLGDRLSEDDLAALDALADDTGPLSVLCRGDLTVRTARTVWAARRPEPGTAPR
ncbi:hypothetical protein GCM10018793_17040 [Streptomyces sulfonofaciens]|uniref:Methyltransferase domain-containing protein n=1 Tax=Streptomyces sulfonofaciens TaxID=68272 RepID=A0A919FZR4_9ACTN|nr:class I SAM-dependent methyltransferase [Streptomyces sulfonofaciens]GHH74943.1 hypothetical protein GCM10018793_17040 [Streptomyces sulfonofaciens]